jgi:2-aminoadipate transaminase
VKLLYLVSYFQNPTGITTSFARKAEALALLRRYEKSAGHPVFLLEDAAYRPLRFAGKEVPSALCARRGAERVIYTGTFSKPFATGIRIGIGNLPPELREVVVRVKGNHDFGSSNFLKQLIAEALHGGEFERQLEVLQARYRHKA